MSIFVRIVFVHLFVEQAIPVLETLVREHSMDLNPVDQMGSTPVSDLPYHVLYTCIAVTMDTDGSAVEPYDIR